MKEKGTKSGKPSKRTENEESGELSSSSESSSSIRHRTRSTSRSSSSDSSSSSSSTDSKDRHRKRKTSSKKPRKDLKAEEGEIDSDVETPASASKPESKAKSAVDIEVRLQQLRKLIERTKDECEEAKHKLAKIERAYLKAEAESNKVNMKKCLKYKEKYGVKVDKLKDNLKMYQAKKVKLAIEMKTGQSSSKSENPESPVQSKQKVDTERKRKPDGKDKEEISDKTQSKRQRLSPTMPKKSQPTVEAGAAEQQVTTAKPVADAVSKTAVIKLPFPVLNDKRNMKIILGTLETKRNELVKKCDQNAQTLKILAKKGADKTDERFEKLKQLEQVLESQRDKIEKQLEYVRLAVSLDVLRTRTGSNPALILQNKHAIDQMTSQLNDMYNYMKQENHAAVKKQQELASEAEAAAAEEAARKESAEKLKTLYDEANNSLAALIAHVAATAHAAASCMAGSHFYATYYPQPETEVSLAMKQMQNKPPAVPTKTELAKASTTFASLKDKISCFFQETKKQEAKSNDTKAKASSSKGTGLKLLASSYGDEDEEEEEEEERSEKGEDVKFVEASEPKAKSADSELSDESDSELEIVTTSELKAGSAIQRNYLLPSIKASYFPLKASINASGNFMSRFGQSRQNGSLSDILYK